MSASAVIPGTIIGEMFTELFASDLLTYPTYEALLGCFNMCFTNCEALSKVDAQRLKYLLKHGKLPFKDDNTKVLKGTPIYADYLLVNHHDFFNNKASSYFADSNVAERIIASERFSDSQKKELIYIIPENLLVVSQRLADIVIPILLKFGFETFKESIMKALLTNATNTANKVRLASEMIPKYRYGVTEISELLNILGGNYKEVAERTKHPIWDKSKYILFACGCS